MTLQERMMIEAGLKPTKKRRDAKPSICSLWDAENGKAMKRTDGGPGSGNHGHKGVPGQVGGSAPSKSSDQLKSEYASSTSKATRSKIKSLFDRHTSGNSSQRNADFEIAHHIARKDTIGRALLQKAEIEKAAWIERVSLAKEESEKRYAEQVSEIEQAIKPGGYLSNYTREQLEDMNLWPQKTEFSEPRFYRKGDLGGATMSFTTRPEGANMSWATNGEEGSIGFDHSFTLSELSAMGYVPIAGIKGMDVGMIGESEVLFASKSPSSKQLSNLSHDDVTIADIKDHKIREKAFEEKRSIEDEYFAKKRDAQKKLLADLKNGGKNKKPLIEECERLEEEESKKLTELGKKYGVTLGDHIVPYDIDKDENFDGGPGSGNFGHKGVPGQVGGSAPSGSDSPAKPAKKSKKDFLPATSYTDTPAFQKAAKAAKEARQKNEKAWTRIKEIDEELKKESKPKPQKDWDDSDMLEDLLGRRPKTLTERGKQLQQERAEVWKEMTEADHQFSEEGEKMREMKRDAHRREIKNFHPEPLTPAKSDDYEGFTLEQTSNSYGDEYLRNGKGVICEMTPKEYLERCAFEIFDEATMESCVGAIDEEVAQGYAKQMREGVRFHLPYLNYRQSGQEGRHRAYAAYLAGIEKIPVLIIGRPNRHDGGPGSGNFGHKGRPGEIGGSAPDDGPKEKPSKAAEAAAKDSLLSMTKKRANEQIAQIADRDGDYKKKHEEIRDFLKSLPVGSKVSTPAHWNDSGKPDVLIWQGEYWSTSKSWDAGGWSVDPDELAHYFLADEVTERPLVTSIASTPEEMDKWNEQYAKTYWRNQESIWKKGGGLRETTTIKLRKLEIDRCGDGFDVIGSDGRTYTKFDGKWVDKETYRDADMRKLKSPRFTGDFFAINFGMNGIPAEECDKLRKQWDSFHPKMKARYEKMLREGTFQPALNGKCSHYDPRTGIVHFDAESDANTVIHEMSHKLDDGLVDKRNSAGYAIHNASIWMDTKLPDRHPRSDFESVASVLGFESNGEHWFAGWSDDGDNYEVTQKAMDKYLEFWHKHHDIPGFEAVADAISGQTQNQIRTTILGGGHDEEYWLGWHGVDRASKQSSEYWANFCMCKACGYDKALKLLKKITPNLYAAAEEIWKETFDGESE